MSDLPCHVFARIPFRRSRRNRGREHRSVCGSRRQRGWRIVRVSSFRGSAVTARRRRRIISRGDDGALCAVCAEDETRTPATFHVHIDPRDYAGLNMGPDVACDLSLCAQHRAFLLPWTVEDGDTIGACECGAAVVSNCGRPEPTCDCATRLPDDHECLICEMEGPEGHDH